MPRAWPKPILQWILALLLLDKQNQVLVNVICLEIKAHLQVSVGIYVNDCIFNELTPNLHI